MACTLLKDEEEKGEEKDSYDFVFLLLEKGSNLIKIEVAHAPGQVSCLPCKTNQILGQSSARVVIPQEQGMEG